MLGRGGMGVVYQALDEETGRPVAIKIQHNHKPTPEQIQRFHREGVLTARLDHPGILKIHGGGVTNEGSSFLILELIEGAEALDVYLDERPEEGLDRILELAQALAYAHQEGVIHRDLKPANILVDVHGRLRITDFGLAWASDADRLTRTNAMVGTPLYMAPECFERGRGAVVPASDVWSLGVLLYRELTGRVPFDASTLTALMLQIASSDIPTPLEVDKRVGPVLSAVCMQALQREVRHRYDDAGQFADALEVAMLGGDPRRKRRAGKLGLLAAGLVGAGIAAVAIRPGGTTPEPAPSGTAAPSPTPTASVARSNDPALDELVARTRAIAPRDPLILRAFVDLRNRPGLTASARRRVELERLRYMFRRGRWNDVLNAVPSLETDAGVIGPEAAILHAEVHYALRRAMESRQQRAAEPLRRVLARPEPIAPGARATLEAYLALFENDTARAYDRAKAALAAEPERVSAIIALAVALGRQGRLDATLPPLAQAAELLPDHPQAHILRVLALIKLERPEEALVASRRMMTLLSPDPPPAMAICHLRVYANLNRSEQLEREAQGFLDDDPTSAMWRFIVAYAQSKQGEKHWRGQAALRKLRREDKRGFERALGRFVMTDYRPVLRGQIDRPREVIQAGVLFEQGVDAHRAGRLSEARSLLESSAKGGNPRAMSLLGESLMLGWGGPKDPTGAVHWFRRAVDKANNAYALFGLARCYEHGLGGLPVDRGKAVEYLKRAAKKKLPHALVNLGLYYERGEIVPKDRMKARQLYTEGARKGSPVAMYNLGLTYARDGKPRLALLWYRKALATPKDTYQKAKNDRLARDAIRRLFQIHPELKDE